MTASHMIKRLAYRMKVRKGRECVWIPWGILPKHGRAGRIDKTVLKPD